jgi:hypothetical protein
MIYTYQITSDDDQFSNEDIRTLNTVDALPADAKEYTAEQAAAMTPPDNFFAANFPTFRIYQDDNEVLYFVKRGNNNRCLICGAEDCLKDHSEPEMERERR